MRTVGIVMQWVGLILMAAALTCGATGAVDLILACGIGAAAFPAILFGAIVEAEA